MRNDEDPYGYILRIFSERGLPCPDKYVEMLDASWPDRTIEGLRPWAFDHAPGEMIGFCSRAIGHEALPFAQAIGLDLMACFIPSGRADVAVAVMNPWHESRADVVETRLESFDAWLAYAKKVSEAYVAREREETEGG